MAKGEPDLFENRGEAVLLASSDLRMTKVWQLPNSRVSAPARVNVTLICLICRQSVGKNVSSLSARC